MKHILIIETVDSFPMEDEQKVEFQQEVVRICEVVATFHVGECFVQSRFFEKSAIDAVLEMLGMSRGTVAGTKGLE